MERLTNHLQTHDIYGYRREHIENYIPEHYKIKRLVDQCETSESNENYEYILDSDVKKTNERPLFQTHGKIIYAAEWLPISVNRPEILLPKIDGIQARKEALLYVHLSHHTNIVRSFGFVLNNNHQHCTNSIMFLQEYASLGNLYELLQNKNKNFTEKLFIEIFLQNIDAMIYLTLNDVVHGDLACRNILVFRFDEINLKNILVKLTDFSLSQYLFTQDRRLQLEEQNSPYQARSSADLQTEQSVDEDLESALINSIINQQLSELLLNSNRIGSDQLSIPVDTAQNNNSSRVQIHQPICKSSKQHQLSSHRYQVREKLWHINTTYKVKDETDKDIFIIRSKTSTIGDSLLLKDMYGK
ncbi:unnamed protein product [Rotaria sp. Silwood2]|nr:unnamed protein product [Rotaria sp. Silwood2]